MAQLTIPAIVLAGGKPDEVAALQPGAPNKAFVEIAGVTLAARTIAALRGARGIGRIVAVAPPAAHGLPALAQADELRPDGELITQSLRNGLEGFPPGQAVLVAASDLPVLTPEAVDDFVARVGTLDADVTYGCVEKRVHMARFPQVPHTWARLRDGTFCGGGLMALRPRAQTSLERFLERLGAARKDPLRLASLFGWDVLARYAIGRLSIAAAERRASTLLGAPVRALISPYAETAVNVDRVSDVPLAEELVRAARSA